MISTASARVRFPEGEEFVEEEWRDRVELVDASRAVSTTVEVRGRNVDERTGAVRERPDDAAACRVTVRGEPRRVLWMVAIDLGMDDLDRKEMLCVVV